MYKILGTYTLRFFFALILTAHSAYAYNFKVTNVTGKTIAIQINGVLTGNMMKGEFKHDGILPTQKFYIKDFGNTKTIYNAGHLDGPYTIPHNHTVEFIFSNWDIGVCFDLSQISVGMESNGFNMVSANVVALPNEWYDTIFKAAANSGGSIEKIGQAVGEKFGGALDNVSSVVPEPKVQAIMKAAALATQGVGVATEAIGSLVGIVGSVIRSSSCKNMSFIATKTTDDDYTVSLLTRQQ